LHSKTKTITVTNDHSTFLQLTHFKQNRSCILRLISDVSKSFCHQALTESVVLMHGMTIYVVIRFYVLVFAICVRYSGE